MSKTFIVDYSVKSYRVGIFEYENLKNWRVRCKWSGEHKVNTKYQERGTFIGELGATEKGQNLKYVRQIGTALSGDR
jgi:hypothetical protein